MSHIIEQYISQCRALFRPCPQCDNGICNIDNLCDCKCNSYSNCMDCLWKIFFESKHRMRRYQCLPITYSYVEHYTDAFASEIYRILLPFDEIWSNIDNKNIVSIGCGPATELIAIEKIMRDKSIQSVCNYIGFDPNPIWNSTWNILLNIFNSHNIRSLFQNSMLYQSNPVLQDTKLLILNYVVSDVYKHAKSPRIDTVNFLQNDITSIIQQLSADSYILINDVNSKNMGREEIEEWEYQITGISNTIEMGYFENIKHPDEAKYRNISAKRRKDRNSAFYFNNSVLCQSAYSILKKI